MVDPQDRPLRVTTLRDMTDRMETEQMLDFIPPGFCSHYNVSGPVGQVLREKGVGRTRAFDMSP